MKKSHDTIGNRTRYLVAQCLYQLRHRVSDASCVPHADAVAEILCVPYMNLAVVGRAMSLIGTLNLVTPIMMKFGATLLWISVT